MATFCAAKCSSGDSVATPRAFTEPGRPRQSSSLRDVSGRVALNFECNVVVEDLCLAVQVEGDLRGRDSKCSGSARRRSGRV